jgi:hypothetical protein
MSKQVEFTVNGQAFAVSADDVLGALRGVAAEPIRSHSVTVTGIRYPVKQAFAAVTGLDRLDFTSAVARRNLAKLGFELHRS